VRLAIESSRVFIPFLPFVRPWSRTTVMSVPPLARTTALRVT
jgi:hypothetical protein